ncbi:MAG: hypothetical protein ACTS5G_01705, partial [Burkholderiales bacterium]
MKHRSSFHGRSRAPVGVNIIFKENAMNAYKGRLFFLLTIFLANCSFAHNPESTKCSSKVELTSKLE